MWFTEQYTKEELEVVKKQRNAISREIENATEFKLQSHHLYLLNLVNFDYGLHEDCYEGTFYIHEKRPFKQLSWAVSVANALGETVPPNDDEYMAWYTKNYLRYYRIYREMQIVLDIAVQSVGDKFNFPSPIEPGDVFEKEDKYSFRWHPKKVKKDFMSVEEVKALRPEFMFGEMSMVDWFEVNEGDVYFGIRSGLKHADGQTKSPYYYSNTEVGVNSKEQALKKFSKWWNSKKK